MKIGLVGLPQVGKTTIFNLLTHGHADTSTWGGRGEAHLGLTRVHDARLDKLAEIFRPKKVTPTTIEYIDVPGMARGNGKAALAGQARGSSSSLNSLKNVDALAHIVRAFEDDSILHSEGTVDPARDIGLFELEMIFSDLGIVEKRLDRLTKDLRKMKSSELEFEHEMLSRFRIALEQEQPLRELTLSAAEDKVARGFTFLSAKPLLVVMNLDDRDSSKIDGVVEEFQLGKQASKAKIRVCAVCGKIESEIETLTEEDASMFMEDLGITRGGPERLVSESYCLLGLASFYTTEGSELRAWPFPQGTTALAAAGMIHTDIAKGFIKAEVVTYSDILTFHTFQTARSKGALRLEGKEYLVQDGDVILFRFNV
jgi:GTP-binding protein YchF